MFLVVYRKPGRGEVYDDDVVLVTENLAKAVNKAKAYAPWARQDVRGWTHHADKAFVFRYTPEKHGTGDLVYARWSKKRGKKMRWPDAWGDSMWKRAYDRMIREAGWAAKREDERRFQEFRRIVREQEGRAATKSWLKELETPL